MPTDSVVLKNAAPVPIAPSRLDVHARPAVRLPSSPSLAEPLKLIGSVSTKLEASGGQVMLTDGGVLAFTVRLIWANSPRPWLSVTLAVMV